MTQVEDKGGLKITIWGVDGEREETSRYSAGGKLTRNPVEFHSFAKSTVVSALVFCFTFSTPITHFLSSQTSRSFIGTK